MRFKYVGSKQDHVAVEIRSAESTNIIKQGAPVFIKLTGDGVDVLSAIGLADNVQSTFYGFAINDINPGSRGEAMAFGFFEQTRILLRSRAASTIDWPVIDEQSIGAPLEVFTALSAQAMLQINPGAPGVAGYFAVLAASYASAASLASATSNSSLYSIANLRSLVRCL